MAMSGMMLMLMLMLMMLMVVRSADTCAHVFLRMFNHRFTAAYKAARRTPPR